MEKSIVSISISAVCRSLLLATLLLVGSSRSIAANNEYAMVDGLFEEDFIAKTTELVKIETYRNSDGSNEKEVVENLEIVREQFKVWVDEFNKGQKTLKFEFFEWSQTIDGKKPWLFGFRLGTGARRISIITHLDTVTPGNLSWKPFEARVEKRNYLGKETDFLVGRGALDDKGPAVVSFAALKSLAKTFDGTDRLKDFTMELLFDTSEETAMSMPEYFKKNPGNLPELGIVFDAMWSIAYEKGIERPVFTVPFGTPLKSGLWINTFDSYPGPTNTIADSATAVIEASSIKKARAFETKVKRLYTNYGFDDPYYRKAALTVTRKDKTVTLTTEVDGAQHGSAPQENREKGANPLVSLGNFLSHLVELKIVNSDGIGQMVNFMNWSWGTHVFGESHPELLERYDNIFEKNNGTTYALTKFVTDEKNNVVTLEVDIRYSLLHHSTAWNGQWGLLQGASQFQDIFTTLVSNFNKTHQGRKVAFSTSTPFGPNLKNKNSPQFSKVTTAFKDVTGLESPILAIGGATDAKDQSELIAAGSLFTDSLGPPVNFHGIGEGAPIEDMRRGARILYRMFLNEVKPSADIK